MRRNTIKTVIHTAAGLVLCSVSILLSLYSGYTGWFTIMLLYSFYLAYCVRPAAALAVSAASILLAWVLTFAVLGHPYSIEPFFVALVWIDGVLIIALMRGASRKARLQERRLEESSAYLRSMIDASPDALIRTDLEGRIVAFSRQHAELLEVQDSSEVLGSSAFDFIVPEERAEAFANMQRVLDEGVVRNMEYRALRVDGSPFDIGLSVSVIRDGAGMPTGFIGILRDITVEKENRRKVEALAAERELLLHEVHHRVKNHMNTIRSILSLQRSSSDDPAVAEALLEAENRVSLMQNIYGRLYQTDQHDSICLPDFMHQLLGELKAALSPGIPVEIEVEVDDVTISARQSLPLAIIVNELVTNSFKYAFDGRAEGIIAVMIKETSPDRLSIRVSDNGPGFPREVSEDHSFGFGLSVVEGYIHQFDGEMNFVCEETGRNGISATIVLEK